MATPTVPPVRPPALPTSANPQFAKAVVQTGQGLTLQLKNYQGGFQPVALQPGQAVNVILTLTTVDAGQPADVEVLDGGAIGGTVPTVPKVVSKPTPPIQSLPVPLPTVPVSPAPLPSPCQAIDCQPIVPDPSTITDAGQTLPVSLAGQLLFSFRPGDGPGMHRVSVIVGGNQYILQFWQQDTTAPNRNLGFLHAY